MTEVLEEAATCLQGYVIITCPAL